MMRKKVLKIAMLGHKSFPSREGGIEVVVAELCTRMAKRGHRVTSFVRHGVRADVPEDHTPGEITVVNGVIVREVPCLLARADEEDSPLRSRRPRRRRSGITTSCIFTRRAPAP